MTLPLSKYFLSRHPTFVIREVEDQRAVMRFYANGFSTRTPYIAVLKDSNGVSLHSVDLFTNIHHSFSAIVSLFKTLLMTDLDGSVELLALSKVELTECPRGICQMTIGTLHVATIDVDESGKVVRVNALLNVENAVESITALFNATPTKFHYVTKQIACKYREEILRSYTQLAACSKNQLKETCGVVGSFRDYLSTLDDVALNALRLTLRRYCQRKDVHVVQIHDTNHTYVSEAAGSELRLRTGLKLAELKSYSTLILVLDPSVKILTAQWLKGYLRDSITHAGSDWAFVNRYKFVGFESYDSLLTRTLEELYAELFD